VWIGIALLLDRWQQRLDRSPDLAAARRMQVFSGPALAALGLTLTFASIDWLMSLEPDWYSTIFGFLYAAGAAVPALGFAVAAAAWLAPFRSPSDDESDPAVWGDLGNLLLAMVMLWAYISFSQLLLIWSGNLPEEITWYLKRSQGGWQYVGIFLAVFYFALPFVLLLSRDLKRDPRRLRLLAVALVVVSVVHHFWLVNPVYAYYLVPDAHATYGTLTIHWLDLAALAGVGGITFAYFVHQLRARPLTPPQPVLVEEATHHA
jgi:hypothetical protein